MKNFFILAVLVLTLSLVALAQVPNKISYQGLLTTSAGTPVQDGSYDLKFDLFNVPSGGTSLWTETHPAVPVQRGTFNVLLGSITVLNISFNQTLYVEITATGPGIPSPIKFSPRSELTSSPYSFSVIGTQCEASGPYSSAGGRNNRALSAYDIVCGGGNLTETDANHASGGWSAIVGGWSNRASAFATFVGGGVDNRASSSGSAIVGGQLNTASGYMSFIGGGSSNRAFNYYSAVSGGAYNTASGYYSFVGGGYDNVARGDSSAIIGGYFNIASGRASVVAGGSYGRARGPYSFVGGGGGVFLADSNSASHEYSIVVGGSRNIASGSGAFIGGGYENTASGSYATVPGGVSNSALGAYSFAAGRRAKANHDGAFVWADGFAGDFASSTSNQFNVRASGGTRIFSNTGLTAGVTLAAGASAWASVSDSTLKRNKRLVNSKEILDKVAHLPIMRWSYLSQDPTIEHIGPMAQDFYAIFGLGEDEKTISTIDPAGVALAAIQELAKQNQELKTKNEELASRLNELESMVKSLVEEKKTSDKHLIGELK